MNIDGLPEIVKNEKLTLVVLLYEFREVIVDVLVGIDSGLADKVILLEIMYVVDGVYVKKDVVVLLILGDIVIVTVKTNDLVGVAVAVFVIIERVWVVDIVIVLDEVVVDDCELEDVADFDFVDDFVSKDDEVDDGVTNADREEEELNVFKAVDVDDPVIFVERVLVGLKDGSFV